MRASWLVDAKWVAGLLCLFCVLAAGGLYSVTALTGRETATGIFTATVGGTLNSQLSDEEYAAVAAAAAANPDGEDGGEFSTGPVRPLTRDTHDAIYPYYLGFAIAALALCTPLVFFSRRFGRLGSPGLVLMIGSAPFALVWRLLDNAAAGITGEKGVFASALAASIRTPAADLSSTFTRLAFLGAGLTGAAIAGHVAWPLALRAYRRWIAPKLATGTPAA